MPQLALKIPVFRRWGKKFFVAVDSHFFASLPPMRSAGSLVNSEVTWMVYPFALKAGRHQIGEPLVRYSTWDDVLEALREGNAPDPVEILREIARKAESQHLLVQST